MNTLYSVYTFLQDEVVPTESDLNIGIKSVLRHDKIWNAPTSGNNFLNP